MRASEIRTIPQGTLANRKRWLARRRVDQKIQTLLIHKVRDGAVRRRLGYHILHARSTGHNRIGLGLRPGQEALDRVEDLPGSQDVGERLGSRLGTGGAKVAVQALLEVNRHALKRTDPSPSAGSAGAPSSG